MNIAAFLAFSHLEVRSLLRLVRTWSFLFCAFGICSTYFVLVTWHHVSFSHLTPNLGSLGPRYIAATLATYFIAIFLVGVVLSAMEIRSRDQRVNMFEVVATRPVSDIEICLGRLVGVLFVFIVPILVFLSLITLYGWVCQLFGFYIGEPVAFYSVASVAFLDVGPNLFFVGSLVVLLTMLVRSRLASATIVLLLVLISMWINFRFPHFITAPFQTVTANVVFPSELAPKFLTVSVVVNRIALIAIGLGFLWIAGSLQPRVTTRRSNPVLLGVGSVLLGVLLIGGNVTASEIGKHRLQQWALIHKEASPASFPDVVHLSGSLKISPGNSITFDFQLQVVPPKDNPNSWVVFSLNPGYRLESIWIDGALLDRHDDYEFQDGLLRVSKLKFNYKLSTLRIRGSGRPNIAFAYLDTPVELRQVVGPATRRLYHMGTESSIFHPRYVALLAGTKWYPTAGSAWHEWDLDRRTRDFFTVDLTVSVPRNWTVAGPGHREIIDDNHQAVFQFTQLLPVPEVSLLGSHFIRRAIKVSDVEFELLISPVHKHLLQTFQPLANGNRLESWISNRLERVREAVGIELPYSSISIVEVPSSLRTYGSGWQLDSTLSAPGIVMIRETGFPTARFESWTDSMFVESENERWSLDSQVISFLMRQVDSYFAFDMQGENPSLGVINQLFEFHTAPSGPGATALEFMLKRRALNRIGMFGQPLFSFWECLDPFYAELFTLNTFWSRENYFKEMQKTFFSVRDNFSLPSKVWEFLESQSLEDLDTSVSPHVVYGVLHAKSAEFLRFLSSVPRSEDGVMITTLEARLLQNFRGTTFSVEEFLSIASREQDDLPVSLRSWLSSGGLAGYQIGAPDVEVRVDKEAGVVTYVNSFRLRNTQPTPGSVMIAWDISPESKNPRSAFPDYEYSTASIAGEKAYLVTKNSSVPLERVWVKTGLSLNRNSLLRLDIVGEPKTSPEPIIDSPPITLTEWMPSVEQGIVIDDLDPGFSIESHTESFTPSRFVQYVKRLFPRSKLDWDYGLPLMHYDMQGKISTNGVWVREVGQLGFGRYRNTYAQFIGGSISLKNPIEDRRKIHVSDTRLKQKVASARFSTTVPNKGAWQLSYHVPFESVLEQVIEYPFSSFQEFGMRGPQLYLPNLDLGTIELEVRNGNDTSIAKLDYSEAKPGWNVIGVYELKSTKVDVYISNVTDGEIVIADAIRWSMNSLER